MRKPRIPHETIALIKKMAKENCLWGAERIRGELLKLDIQVSKRAIQRYMSRSRQASSQTWATFIKNHVMDIWACGFMVVHGLFFRPIYIFVILELKTRRVVHTAVTVLPTDAWTAQQLREATPWGSGPRYLIRDRDRKYGSQFSCVAASTGIKELKTADGRSNMPDGETFTSLVDESMQGYITFEFPGVYAGKRVERIRLEFSDGEVVNASSRTNNDLLQKVLQMDEGLSALASSKWAPTSRSNISVTIFFMTKKLVGRYTLRLEGLIPNAYSESGGINQSALHWDIIKDLRAQGEINLDGQMVFKFS